MHRLALIIFFIIKTLSASAQSWEAGISRGRSGYIGDLNDEVLKFTDFAYGVLIKRNFDGYLTARLNYTHGGIQGSDPQLLPGSFTSNLDELALMMEFNFFDYRPGDRSGYRNPRLSPFIFGGVAGVKFNPSKISQLKSDSTRISLSIPLGFGVKYNIIGNFSLIGELGYRKAFTDNLEGFSQDDPDPMILKPSDYQRDTYMFTTISITYTLARTKQLYRGKKSPVHYW